MLLVRNSLFIVLLTSILAGCRCGNGVVVHIKTSVDIDNVFLEYDGSKVPVGTLRARKSISCKPIYPAHDGNLSIMYEINNQESVRIITFLTTHFQGNIFISVSMRGVRIDQDDINSHGKYQIKVGKKWIELPI